VPRHTGRAESGTTLESLTELGACRIHAGRAESGTTLESLTETSTQQYEIMAAVSRQSLLTVTWVEWHCSRLIIAVALGEQERMCATILKCGGLTWMIQVSLPHLRIVAT